MEIIEIVARLDSLISAMTALKTELLAGEPAFPAWAQDLVDQRICLVCKKRIAETDTPNRGNHEKHYRKVKRAIERGELTETEAISQGLLAPAKQAGRPRKSLMADVERARMNAEADADVAAAEAMLRQRRKTKKRT